MVQERLIHSRERSEACVFIHRLCEAARWQATLCDEGELSAGVS